MVTGPFVADALARGQRPPLRFIDRDARAWALLERDGDALCVDEFGEVWWAHPERPGDVRVVRALWPEEHGALLDGVRTAIHEMTADTR